MRVVGGVQTRLGRALRARVAGPDADLRAREIWGTPGERWFAPGDPIWRVHEDAAMFPGGIAALLLQSLHPLAMAGVAGHSGFRGDPWGRLQRTSHYLAGVTFGTIEHAEATIARVQAIHARVQGNDFRGRPYRASDPHLLRWVHVAQTHAFLHSHQNYGAQRLSRSDADRYVAQAAVPALLLGATDLPTTTAELEQQLLAFRPELELTPAARDAATLLLWQPPVPVPARPGYGLLAAGAVAVLPRWAVRLLGLPMPGIAALIGAPLGGVGTGAVRWALAGVPRRSALFDRITAEPH